MTADPDTELGTIAVHRIGGLWYFGQDLARRPDLRKLDDGTGASHVLRLPDGCRYHDLSAASAYITAVISIPGRGNVTAGRLVEMAEEGTAGVSIAATIL